jgi:RNase adapter protein RapZ
MIVRIVSFGYKHRSPATFADEPRRVIDCRRGIRNPYREPHLRALDGLDQKVRTWIEQDPAFPGFWGALKLEATVDHGTRDPMIWYLGCTGGRHRSVYLASRLGQELQIPVTHWDVRKHT